MQQYSYRPLRSGLVATAITGSIWGFLFFRAVSQGLLSPENERLLPVMLALGAAILAAAGGSLPVWRLARLMLLSAAAGLLLILAILGIWSIGIPLFIAWGFTLAAIVQVGKNATPFERLLAALLALIILSTGFFIVIPVMA